MTEQLTCELNGVKYLKFSLNIPAHPEIKKSIAELEKSIERHEGLIIKFDYSNPSFFSTRKLTIEVIIPEHNAISFSKEKTKI